MRDYKTETQKRIEFIQSVLKSAGADGIVFGNSGGKDCALTGILCKMACSNTLGIIMPCVSKRNYETDKIDAEKIARQFDIATCVIDLTDVRNRLVEAIGLSLGDNPGNSALTNIAPRLRMTTLYAVAANKNMLVAGTGNRSEIYMGYFTKWGDGACDFNPIADLTVTEIYEFLKYLKAPEFIINKAPSAGLFDGQTDESEMGISYKSIDEFIFKLNENAVSKTEIGIIERFHNLSSHKRRMPLKYGEDTHDN